MDKQQHFLPVGEAYDRWAPVYDAYDNPMVFMATQIVDRFSENASGLRVLEFGCGTGRNLAALSAQGAIVTGCDLSAGMLDVARLRTPDAELLLHDMTQTLPFADRRFDVSLFSLSLEHVQDLLAPLGEAKRVTKPGGRILIIEIHPFLSLSGSAAHFDEGDIEVRMPTFPHQFADYLSALAEVGLAVAECREWRPADVGNPVALESHKRGPEIPLTVELVLKV
jgi:malonyl-CoA O-methyltransferase